MKEQDNIPSQSIIQISLFKHQTCSAHYIQQSLLLAFVVGIGICVGVYKYSQRTTIVAYLIIMIIALLLVFLLRVWKYCFPKSKETLVFAYGELQVIRNYRVLDFEHMKQLSVKTDISTPFKIPLIEIKGLTFPQTILALHSNQFNHLDFNTKIEVDYWIHSKKDWQLLLQYLNPRG